LNTLRVAIFFAAQPALFKASCGRRVVRHLVSTVMSIIATVMNSATGQPIQKMTFGRMPKPWVSFNLDTGELVTADRVHVGKPAPGKFAAPVEVWVTPKR
jgi:hypothetical protein